MHAITMAAPGDAGVLRWTEQPDPVLGADDVLIDVAASGVNFRDIYFRRGVYPAPPGYIPGQEAAGRVAAVGANVSNFAPGDRVVAMLPSGAYAERVVAPARSVAHVPDYVSLEDAAAVELQGLTAHVIMTSCSSIKPGDWVVVHAAAGGLGLMLTRIAKHLGAHVIGTVSSLAKADAARAAGADVVGNYDDFAAIAAERSGGKGLAAVFDGVGAATYLRSLEALSPTGTLVLFGWVSGLVPTIDLDLLKSRTFVRPRLNEFIGGAEFGRRIDEVFEWMRNGVIQATIGARFALCEAGKAQDALESRSVIGKVLLVTDFLSAEHGYTGETQCAQ